MQTKPCIGPGGCANDDARRSQEPPDPSFRLNASSAGGETRAKNPVLDLKPPKTPPKNKTPRPAPKTPPTPNTPNKTRPPCHGAGKPSRVKEQDQQAAKAAARTHAHAAHQDLRANHAVHTHPLSPGLRGSKATAAAMVGGGPLPARRVRQRARHARA